MTRNRRKFLKYMAVATGTALGGGVYWLSTSQRWMAKFARMMMADAKRAVLPAPLTPKPSAWNDNGVTLAWLGHSTVLLNFYGINILTDPVFGSRVGVRYGLGTAGPKRYVAAALKPKDLPRIDLVLLSHAHMDHMDLASLEAVAAAPIVVTARSTRDVFESAGFKETRELGWGEETLIRMGKGDVQVSAFEVRHWGQRWPKEMERGYNGYILKREGRAILFGGDTADTPLFADIKAKGPFDVAIMPIGAYQPWVRSHCNPEQAVAMANAAGAKHLVPVHHQTFKLSEEPLAEPIQRFAEALASEPERLALSRIGQTFTIPGA